MMGTLEREGMEKFAIFLIILCFIVDSSLEKIVVCGEWLRDDDKRKEQTLSEVVIYCLQHLELSYFSVLAIT